jgi:hypothetical protein
VKPIFDVQYPQAGLRHEVGMSGDFTRKSQQMGILALLYGRLP